MKFLLIGVHRAGAVMAPPAIAIPVGRLRVSALELHDDAALADRDLIVRAANVRAELLERGTFIAIRYGAAPHTEAEVKRLVEPQVARWERLLERRREHVEMTMKIVTEGGVPRPRRENAKNGADYLRALHASTRSANVPEEFRAAVEAAFRDLAARAKWSPRDEQSVEYAMLVKREDAQRVRDAGEALKQQWKGVPFLLSGPWPLEAFADDDDHE